MLICIPKYCTDCFEDVYGTIKVIAIDPALVTRAEEKDITRCDVKGYQLKGENGKYLKDHVTAFVYGTKTIYLNGRKTVPRIIHTTIPLAEFIDIINESLNPDGKETHHENS